MKYSTLLAERTSTISVSAIREILKVVSQPEVVSLAGGIPAPESFPLSLFHTLTEKVLETFGPAAFQYDLSEGFGPLREVISGYLRMQKIESTADDVLVMSGSQSVLNALGMVLINRGECVAVEAPTYLGALQAFNPYGPLYVRLETDDDGLIPESLEAVATNSRIKMVYLVPTFQNPTGRTLPLDRRMAIADILKRHELLLIEDDPYSALRYEGEALPAIKTFAPDHVVYMTTLSKVFAPGLRIGFCVAPEKLRKWLVVARQGIDLHTSTYNQALATVYIDGGYLEAHLPKIIALYASRKKAMLQALLNYFPDSFHWSKPSGGMFLWVKGAEGMDMEIVNKSAIKRKTAFVPGRYFFSHPNEGYETMRLNFTMADEKTIDRAVLTLSEVIKDHMSMRNNNDLNHPHHISGNTKTR